MVKYSDSNLDMVFKSLSDPTRRRIIEKLSKKNLMITDIASEFDVSLPAVSKHIKILERAGIVKRNKDGKIHKISLNPRAIREASVWIERYERF